MSNTSENPPVPTTKPVDRVVRRALVAELPDELRAVRMTVLRETLASGVPVHPEALAVVLAAHHDFADSVLTFTASHVEELLWFGVSEFCEDLGLDLPDGCPAALYAILAVVCAGELLDAASDPVTEVFAAFHQLAAS
jgi:hypothetical protein